MSKDDLQNFDEYASEYETMLNRAVEFAGEDGEYYAEYKVEKLDSIEVNISQGDAWRELR